MKRSVLILGLVLVSVFAAISVWRAMRNTAETGTAERSELSAERKAEIRQFWDVYREAADLRRQGAWGEAVVAYREALKIDPRHEDALYYSGNALFELEKYEEAVTAWRQLVEVNPLSGRAHIQLGSVYSCGAEGAPFDLDIAEQEFQRALAINKEQTGPILKLGEVYLLSGQSKEAISYFTTALQSNSKSVEAHYLVGYLKWRAGEHDAALSSLQKAVEFSQVKRPAGMPLGEGATRTGTGPMLAEGASRRSFFASHWMALKTWIDEDVSGPRMEEEYRDLDRRLGILVAQ